MKAIVSVSISAFLLVGIYIYSYPVLVSLPVQHVQVITGAGTASGYYGRSGLSRVDSVSVERDRMSVMGKEDLWFVTSIPRVVERRLPVDDHFDKRDYSWRSSDLVIVHGGVSRYRLLNPQSGYELVLILPGVQGTLRMRAYSGTGGKDIIVFATDPIGTGGETYFGWLVTERN